MAAKWLKKLLGGLKKVAPTLIGGVVAGASGPLAGITGPIVANLMRKVTGAPAEDMDLEGMAQKILGSPELQLGLEQLAIERERIELEKLKAVNDLERSKWEAETARIAAVNETMRVEAESDKWWQSGWRPYWGFISGTAWGILIVSISILILTMAFGPTTGDEVKAVGEAIFDMLPLFAIAGAMVGVTAWWRGKEKTKRIEAQNGS